MDLKEILAKRVDLKGLVMEDIYDGLIVKKLDELAKDSENTLDDALLAMIEPILRDYLEKELDKLSEKYLAPEPDPAA